MTSKWEQVIVSPESSIREALSVIDQHSLRIALVADNERRLLGTVTDGDIRRGLLRNLEMDCLVTEVMNCDPVTVKEGLSKLELKAIMESREILALPVVSGCYLVGLETLHDVITNVKYDNPVFLMAGGFGTRLKPLTDKCPKPLLKVGGKPILETILVSFVEAGFTNFFISTHYLSEQIRDYFGDGSKWGVTIEYLKEDEPLGTGGALGLLPEDLPDHPLIVMNGDLLTKVDFGNLLSYHNQSNAAATMCVREYEYQIPYGVVHADGQKIRELVEKPKHKFFVNAGIYVLDRKILRSVKKNQYMDMPNLLEKEIANDKTVSMFPLYEYWLDIGKMDDFERAQADIKEF